MPRILVLLDGSHYAPSVCDYTALVALQDQAEVDLLHVLQREQTAESDLSGNIGLGARSKLLEDLARLDAERATLAKTHGRAILEDAQERLTQAGVQNIASRLRHGVLIEEVAQAEQGCDLVIIGKRGESADAESVRLGSHLEQVIRSSTIPVLIAPRAFKPISHALIAFDGGQTSRNAVDFMVSTSHVAPKRITLLTVGNDTTGVQLALKEAAQQLTEAGFDVSTRVAPGRADSAIAQTVSDLQIDLLVMGAFSHSRIRNLFIGSTTTETIRACHVPILMIR